MDLQHVSRAIRRSPLLARLEGVWTVVRPPYERLLRVLYGRRGMPLAVGGGEQIQVDPICRRYVWEEHEEAGLWAALTSEVRRRDRFADIGANIGIYTIAAARRGARVMSFEPNPRVAALLRRNVALNGIGGRVDVREVALAASPGEMHLAIGGTLDMGAHINQSGGVAVRAETLSEPFDVVKIDVEGYEYEVLRGAAPLLADSTLRPRAIFIELHCALHEASGANSHRLGDLLPEYHLTRLAAPYAGRDREHWLA